MSIEDDKGICTKLSLIEGILSGLIGLLPRDRCPRAGTRAVLYLAQSGATFSRLLLTGWKDESSCLSCSPGPFVSTTTVVFLRSGREEGCCVHQEEK